MSRVHFAVVLSWVGLFLAAPTLDGGESMQMRVSPTVSMAPGFLTVRINLPALSSQDRLLQVVAESPDFYRRSEIPLDGANAPRLNVFEFRNLPTGFYHVTSVLVGPNGPRAKASGMAKVEPSPGR